MQDILSTTGTSTTCAIALVIKDKKILLGHRHYEEVSLWTCPGGRSDFGETIETTLRRETTEEIGVDNLEIKQYLGEFPGYQKEDVVYVFHCTTNQDIKLMEPEKFSEWKWFSKEELPDYIINKGLQEIVSPFL
jgi:ADP-ribose pyrophosphatase YjhB (NUDIX family)